jgi:hypothetical protein
LCISVDSSSTQRALRVADGVLRAAETMGWTFEAPPKGEDPWRRRYQMSEYSGPTWGCIQVEREPVQITITERRKQVPHVLSKYEMESRARGYQSHLPPWDLAYTGDLRLNLMNANEYVFKTLADRTKRRLEEQLPDVMHAMLEHALEEKRRREQRRIEEEAERERQRLAGLAGSDVRRTRNSSPSSSDKSARGIGPDFCEATFVPPNAPPVRVPCKPSCSGSRSTFLSGLPATRINSTLSRRCLAIQTRHRSVRCTARREPR